MSHLSLQNYRLNSAFSSWVQNQLLSFLPTVSLYEKIPIYGFSLFASEVSFQINIHLFTFSNLFIRYLKWHILGLQIPVQNFCLPCFIDNLFYFYPLRYLPFSFELLPNIMAMLRNILLPSFLNFPISFVVDILLVRKLNYISQEPATPIR